MPTRRLRLPFYSVARSQDALRGDLTAAIQRVVRRGEYILGHELDLFEREFAAYLGVRHVVGVASGLDALILLLRGLGVQAGDEVIVPSNTFIATWLAVSQVGAVPVAVEPCRDTFNLDPACVESAVSPRTRAILAVHLYGQPADMDALRSIADRSHLWLLEDAAQAHGALYKGRHAGALSHGAAFSFYPTKNLGALGDGGCVTTDDDVLAAKVRRLRNYGSRLKYVHTVQGVNSRLDEVQAACLRVKLRYLNQALEQRRQLAALYSTMLAGIAPSYAPYVPSWAEPAWHLYVIRTAARDQLQEALQTLGIGTAVHYPKPPHLQGAYRELGYRPGNFPIAEEMADSVLSLPMASYFSGPEQRLLLEGLKTAIISLSGVRQSPYPDREARL